MLCSTVQGHRQPSRSLSKGLLVEVVHSVAGADPLEVGDVVSQLLDARHLLVQEVALDEVCHLWEIKGGGEKGVNKDREKLYPMKRYVYEKVSELEGRVGWTYVEVTVLVGNLVQVQKCLVDGLLQLQGSLHGIDATDPVVLGRLLDVLKHDAAATVVLELHEGLGVLHFLTGGLAEVLGKARESHIVTLKVVGLRGGRREK